MTKNKKLILNTALVLSLLSFLPNQVLSIPTNNSTNKYSGLYFAGNYKLDFPVLNKFSIKETNFNTKQVIGLSKKREANTHDILSYHSAFNEPYTPKFQNITSNFSGTIGYFYTNNLNFEVEVHYEKFDAEIPTGFIYADYIKDAYRYFALARETSSSISDASLKTTPKYNNYVVMKNNGISIISVMANNCYQFFTSQSNKISSHICGGIGTDLIHFFDKLHTKLACQVKLGISYSPFSHYQLFANVYYHDVIGNNFNKLKTTHNVLGKNTKSIELDNISATATLNINYFGSEVGLRFIL
ncbi:P44/Msp2 family outer membrane protein [Ehrlichia ruminantium]|uniref:P44/Msp2 family outer membrane protein n=1 Tax=Ehrlichia ruminantium TaxID=779 RepID=A0AAE6QAT8_EHRRU|nr:P44/Msp2 family outer membrane protein [Ehrlichia ruminantium]QGR02931.1 P44/Msp2 family outer membrane protein [Ehrlichia ruminantium]QGR03855.1 P44/Msp2 family outer membrane protein [Ehrlichia ruminantium]QGR04782.1 P44/Msp2 family outer membrane protein [Ehrlichia ruminantium]